jgi:hypothetical protein
MVWARHHINGYECSSKGDTRFSALFAKLPDGRTIEEAYQLDVKGYRVQGDDWRLGKGKPPLLPLTPVEQWDAYLALWRTWAEHNVEAFVDLCLLSKKHVLTDRFASTPMNQAHALSVLCEEALKQAEAGPFEL